MSLSDLASLGNFISGIAVLASLVFLFFQMRQMTEQVRQSGRNQRALMIQGTNDRVGTMLRWAAEPHVADVIYRATTGETKFTGQELGLLELQLRQSLLSCQDLHVQHQAGFADQITYETGMLALRRLLSLPVYRAVWKSSRGGIPQIGSLLSTA